METSQLICTTKSINWFSYDGNNDLEWVNKFVINAVLESFCSSVTVILANFILLAISTKMRMLLARKK